MANLISGFRISERLLERVHTLTEHLAQVDHIAIITQVSRSVVMRIALLEGLVSWEANYGLEGGVSPNASGAARGRTRGRRSPDGIDDGSVHVALGLPAWLLDRAQRVAEVLDTDPEMGCEGHASRALVLRMCLSKGVHALEDRYIKGPHSIFRGLEDAPYFPEEPPGRSRG